MKGGSGQWVSVGIVPPWHLAQWSCQMTAMPSEDRWVAAVVAAVLVGACGGDRSGAPVRRAAPKASAQPTVVLTSSTPETAAQAPPPKPPVRYRGMALGSHSTCAWTTTGTVNCWWHHVSGAHAPSIDEQVVEVAYVGDYESWCARGASGAVYCWRGKDKPRIIGGVGQAERLVAGAPCAIVQGDRPRCWETLHHGSWRTESDATSPSAFQNRAVVDIVANDQRRCLLFADGSVGCAGVLVERFERSPPAPPGTASLLSNTLNVVSVSTPWSMAKVRPKAAVEQFGGPCCLRTKGGRLKLTEQLCNNGHCTYQNRTVPGLRDVAHLFGGTTNNCGFARFGAEPGCFARRSNGDVVVVTPNSDPLPLGWRDPSFKGMPHLRYKKPIVTNVAGFQGAQRIAWFGFNACAVLMKGEVVCGSAVDGFKDLVTLDGASPAVELKIGDSRACVVRKDGEIRCWEPDMPIDSNSIPPIEKRWP